MESPPPIPPDYPAPDILSQDLGTGGGPSTIHLASKPGAFFSISCVDNGVDKGTCHTPFQNKTSSPIMPKASLPRLKIESPSTTVRPPLHSDSTNSFDDDDSFEASLV